MKYTPQEVMQFIEEEDVKFIRLAFCDVHGKPKNISIMPHELERAFKYGIAIDASAIAGFGDEVHSDLFLHPDPATITVLPWRPEHGRVVRMFCGSELEFYLFKLDENGEPTSIPYDRAAYMDVAPEDKCENVRREICLALERMGIQPESSHHEEGPGQNEIDFRYSDALSAADNAVTFCTVVKTIAAQNGLYADFSPKPLQEKPGSGFHINISVKGCGELVMHRTMGGILKHIGDMTLFLNPTERSYHRLGANKAPKYISWSSDNRSQLIRVPAADGEYRRFELRSPDCTANPYLAFALLIWAGLDGILNNIALPEKSNVNLYTASPKDLWGLETLPLTRSAAAKTSLSSEFIRAHLPQSLIDHFCER